MIEARALTKVYGNTTAVDGIDFQVRPGLVTGFLGPNGAGKSTTMRMILGLDLPTSGTVTVNGRRYRGEVWPLHEVGALLDARAVHPGRSAYNHLHSLAAANGIDPEGIIWIRTLMRSLAAEGRTVLVSSHLMSEMALTADHLLVIGRGR